LKFWLNQLGDCGLDWLDHDSSLSSEGLVFGQERVEKSLATVKHSPTANTFRRYVKRGAKICGGSAAV